MADKRPQQRDGGAYIVANPREAPADVPIITIGEGDEAKHYFAGDAYDGPNIEGFREERLLVTAREAEETQSAARDAETIPAETAEEEGGE